MGLLSVGQPLTWEETADVAEYIKEHWSEFEIYFFRIKHKYSRSFLLYNETKAFFFIAMLL